MCLCLALPIYFRAWFIIFCSEHLLAATHLQALVILSHLLSMAGLLQHEQGQEHAPGALQPADASPTDHACGVQVPRQHPHTAQGTLGAANGWLTRRLIYRARAITRIPLHPPPPQLPAVICLTARAPPAELLVSSQRLPSPHRQMGTRAAPSTVHWAVLAQQ